MLEAEREILEVIHRRGGTISNAELRQIFPDNETEILHLDQQGLLFDHPQTESELREQLLAEIAALREQSWLAYLEICRIDGVGVSSGLKEGIGFGRRVAVRNRFRRKPR